MWRFGGVNGAPLVDGTVLKTLGHNAMQLSQNCFSGSRRGKEMVFYSL